MDPDSNHPRWPLDVIILGREDEKDETQTPLPGPPSNHSGTEGHVHDLIQAPNTIRIFELNPGSFIDPLQGSFQLLTLQNQALRGYESSEGDFKIEHLWPDRAPADAEAQYADGADYLAISYTWTADEDGPDVHGDTVWLENNMGSIEITQNLSRCLRRIRSMTHTQRLWIDQLCINQGPSGVHDKEQQIPLMRKVYQEARGVLLWVGEPVHDIDTTTTFALLQHLHDAWQNLPFPKENAFTALRASVLHELLRTHRFPMMEDIAWTGLFKFCRRRVFTRLWILQEVCLGRCVGVLCGDHLVDFRMLGEAMHFFNKSSWQRTIMPHHPMPPDAGVDEAYPVTAGRPRSRRQPLYVDNLWQQRIYRLYGSPSPMAELLMDASIFRTDRDFQHDRIYALLGLVSIELESDGSIPAALVPDYTKPYEQVFQDAVRFLLVRDGGECLDVLSLAEAVPAHSAAQPGPSWVPNFLKRHNNTFGLYEGEIHASTLPLGRQFVATVPEFEGTALIVDGSRVDRIVGVCPFEETTHVSRWLDHIVITLGTLLLSPYAIGDDVDPLDALWRTFIRDRVSSQAPESYRRHFGAVAVRAALNAAWHFSIEHLAEKHGVDGDKMSVIIRKDEGLEKEMRLLLWNPQNPAHDGHRMAYGVPGFSEEFIVSVRALAAFTPGLSALLNDRIISDLGEFVSGGPEEHNQYNYRMISASMDFSFYLTEGGLFGLGPISIEEGDEVFVLRGGKTPFALRGMGGKDRVEYRLVGDCYTYGIMGGEHLRRDGFAWDRVRIV